MAAGIDLAAHHVRFNYCVVVLFNSLSSDVLCYQTSRCCLWVDVLVIWNIHSCFWHHTHIWDSDLVVPTLWRRISGQIRHGNCLGHYRGHPVADVTARPGLDLSGHADPSQPG